MSEENTDMKEVESCPFCGCVDDGESTPDNEFVLFETDEKHGKRYYVACEVCNTCGPFAETADDAIRMWNTRKFVPSDAINKHKILLEQTLYVTEELCAAERLSRLIVKAADAAETLSGLKDEILALSAEIAKAREAYGEAVARENRYAP